MTRTVTTSQVLRTELDSGQRPEIVRSQMPVLDPYGAVESRKVRSRAVVLVLTIPNYVRVIIQHVSVVDEVSELLLRWKRGVEDRMRYGYSIHDHDVSCRMPSHSPDL
jgi:hypothetical protein